ncbi:Condensin-2 complex subunit D3 [Auxenochlorella protothecoides]|uniref:Condensin-2 complex subunit D3 n=1 Tax=Auxenochlorella protothecoides TaxID=3075 RepID=A0A087SNH0_AUXPR|nr:Condensin-2 complex subunit D3 [Auxenochlorella protothecoides]KFM27274.1 Condensin-2 complex subunit D3 [Auxenochlorella protothecoides]
MEGVVRVLSRLSHLGQELQATGLSEDGVTTALSSYMSDNLLETPPYWVASAGEALWARLQEAGAGLPHISRALAAIITHSSHDHAVGAVELCFGLLAVDKCPTRGIFDRVLCSSYLGWLRGVQSSGPTAKKRAGRKGKKAAALDTDEDEAMDVDQEHPSPLASSLAGFAGSLRTLGLADQPDVVQDAASTCVDLICKGGASDPQEVSAAYGVLLSLLQPIHGNPRDLCAMVFRHLASGLAAMGGGGGKVARAEVCHQLIAFASSALGYGPRQSPSAATESVAALARAVVLRAADRADARTAAVELAMGLLGLLGPAEGEAFVVFTARLSRTPKACLFICVLFYRLGPTPAFPQMQSLFLRALSLAHEVRLQRQDEVVGRTPASDAAALRGVWLLISKLAEHGVAELPWDFLHHAWLALTAAGESAPAGVAPSLLEAVAHAAGGFPPAEAARLAADLLRALLAFTLAPDAAAAHVAALARLSGPDAAWAPRLAAATRDELAAYVDGLGSARGSPGSNAPGELGPAHARAAAALFLAGELALAGQGGGTTGARLLTLVQTLASDKAHAWTALGKMCLMDEALAKLCVPLFVQQLRSAAAPAVRNNIMVALADLVVQFTALVDAHVPALAACITDDNEVVRSQSLALLANLLQKDYVKWRGPLFHRFLLALVDESPAVARMAEYLLGDALSSQAPNLAYNHFVESFFVLNACREGPGAGAALMRKHLAESVVPVVIDLRRVLESARSPLLADLMLCARVMLKDHKDEARGGDGGGGSLVHIEDILVADRQLAKELLYDMRQAELAATKVGGPCLCCHKTPAPGTAVRLLSRLGRSDGSHCSSGARASGMTPGTEPRLARAAREKQIIVKDEPEVVQAEEQMLALSLPGVAGTPLRQWNPTLAEEMHPGGAAGGGPKVCMEGPGTDRVKGGARKRGVGG